mmetsp:Transcript_17000/g.31279  ORF Transcript_17000/g.31279 Transcript_17000/m.31279 type:complete len:101 (-) Transcript_17000:632-934(-)
MCIAQRWKSQNFFTKPLMKATTINRINLEVVDQEMDQAAVAVVVEVTVAVAVVSKEAIVLMPRGMSQIVRTEDPEPNLATVNASKIIERLKRVLQSVEFV